MKPVWLFWTHRRKYTERIFSYQKDKKRFPVKKKFTLYKDVGKGVVPVCAVAAVPHGVK